MNPIVGIGELLWDMYPDGRKVAGGAPFNFAFHCHQLGHDGVIVSRVGDDELGRELREEVRRLGLSDEHIQTDREHPTGTVQVKLDDAGVPTYTITENVAWDFIGEEGDFDEGFAHDTIAICYGSLALRSPTSRDSILQLVAPGPHMPSALRVFDVNIRRPFLPTEAILQMCYAAADWIKLSEDDIRIQTDLLGQLKSGKAGVFIHTLGPDGCNIFSRTEVGFHLPAVPAQVVDTVGAGDAFTAAMVCLHLEGRPLKECARFASYYAARVCEHQGATPRIDRRDVERAAFGI